MFDRACQPDWFEDWITNHKHSLEDYEHVLDSLHSVTESIDFVGKSVCLSIENGDASVVSEAVISNNISILQHTCHQRLARVQRSIDRVQRASEIRDRQLNMEKSNSVKRLSILATVFLPLSLSASILSMQNRLTDLGLKLFDFLGLFLILGSAAVLILILVKNASQMRRNLI